MKTQCTACEGLGYVIGRQGEKATAEVCACQKACTLCRQTRFRITLQDGYEVAVPCDCARSFERVRAYNAAQIPAAYARKRLAQRGPDDTAGFNDRRIASLGRAKLLVTRYQQASFLAGTAGAESPRGLVLVGRPGLGKTHLLCALLSYLTLERGISARFVDYYQLLAHIRSTFDGKGDESEASILKPLVEVPVLVLDDLGKGQASPWEWTIVDQLITRRYNAGRVVLATTNFPLAADLEKALSAGQARDARHRRARAVESLEDRIGERLVSRLLETAEFATLEGEDYRALIGGPR